MCNLFEEENKKFIELKKNLIENLKLLEIKEKFNITKISFNKEDINKSSSTKFDNISSKKGLYFFKIKVINLQNDSIQTFKKNWKKVKYTPNIIQKRWDKSLKELESQEYVAFYIGKSENIKKRVEEHIYALKKDKTYLKNTSSLRLKEHFDKDNNMDKFEFSIGYIELPIESELLTLLESGLREDLSCIVGKNK